MLSKVLYLTTCWLRTSKQHTNEAAEVVEHNANSQSEADVGRWGWRRIKGSPERQTANQKQTSYRQRQLLTSVETGSREAFCSTANRCNFTPSQWDSVMHSGQSVHHFYFFIYLFCRGVSQNRSKLTHLERQTETHTHPNWSCDLSKSAY